MKSALRAVVIVLALLLAIAPAVFAQSRGETLVVLSSYQNPEMDKLIEAAHRETDAKKYAETVQAFTRIALADVPKVPLVQPTLDVAMQKNVTGYQYWFHRQLDFRTLSKQ